MNSRLSNFKAPSPMILLEGRGEVIRPITLGALNMGNPVKEQMENVCFLL